jgi:hypothetical protein
MSEAVLHARAIDKKNPNRYGVLKMNRYSYYEWEDILEGANREQKKMSNNPPFDA